MNNQQSRTTLFKYLKSADYRWFVGLALCAYLLILLISQLVFHDYRFLWRYMGVPAYKDGLFQDLKVITYAMDCLRQGIDPLMDGSCYKNISFNYPTSWYILQYTGLRSEHTISLAIFLILAFLSTIYFLVGRLTFKEAVFYSLVIVSPPVMLAIERCNNDIFFFIVFFFALYLLQQKSRIRYLAYVIFSFSAMLKIHPVFAFGAALREKKSVILKIVLPAILLFVAYVLLYYPEIMKSSKITPRPYDLFSFGSNVVAYYYYEGMLGFPEKLQIIKLISWGFTALFLGFFSILAFRMKSGIKIPEENKILDSFRIGLWMFIGNFLLGNTYDYRLIFLIFSLPQLLIWTKTQGLLRTLSIAFLIIFLLMIHFPSVVRHSMPFEWLIIAKALLYWGLAAITTILIVLTTPACQIRKLFSRPSSKESPLHPV
jgi:hypothetical protein